MRIKDYNRNKAVSYAHRWAFDRNPAYYDFTAIGGDCTNFASQVIYAGSGVMNPTPNTGWYYYGINRRSPSWTGVLYIYNFLVKNEGIGPFGEETDVSNIEPGDIVQISFDGITFAHTPVIVHTGEVPTVNNILIAAHTFNADNRPLSSYQYKKLRFVHIKGVRY
ncbi:MAG: putative amidase domain protein [Firmicutes bacterium ADurb.Bin193]|nr:MAG: putative amidase domain protein [Firmicutes bacterium ADurb.Bin193]